MDNRFRQMPPQNPQQAIMQGFETAANMKEGMPPSAPADSSLMSSQKVESNTEALASGTEKAGGDGKAQYEVKKGNEITGDYQKEKVSYENDK